MSLLTFGNFRVLRQLAVREKSGLLKVIIGSTCRSTYMYMQDTASFMVAFALSTIWRMPTALPGQRAIESYCRSELLAKLTLFSYTVLLLTRSGRPYQQSLVPGRDTQTQRTQIGHGSGSARHLFR